MQDMGLRPVPKKRSAEPDEADKSTVAAGQAHGGSAGRQEERCSRSNGHSRALHPQTALVRDAGERVTHVSILERIKEGEGGSGRDVMTHRLH